MAFDGSCHCGAVAFTVDADLPTMAMSCNCSYCRRKGFVLAFFPEDQVTLTAGEALLQRYEFNTHRVEHQFCTHCGTQPFFKGVMPDGSPVRAVNLRCVPAVDLDALTIHAMDGASG
ncbi:GFA family protein [Fertoebacter nigrum]|uniref:GFA family protein n=1 Tax=Fertoeibacter niger TaxID=2656921 RepID=A0A8X8GXM2_9RHOB|nr:GFA family protein [Fertoeibacter niger]NUB43316.1 GFA family protein [Fertoeibacter niger]